MPDKGWFKIPGVQEGDRSLAEQMKGLTPGIDALAGKSVLDLGCAEGLIAIECVRAGAVSVVGFDSNAVLIETANKLKGALPEAQRARLSFRVGEVGAWARNPERGRHDVVLALAIVHKLAEPTQALNAIAASALEQVLIRLPRGSNGSFATKHHLASCDVNRTMQRAGFVLGQALPGPRGELVQHWRRR